MAEDLLDGATRVLERSGGEHFTTNHVAEATGTSIGSLYQYYPNKAALLAALHRREAEALWGELTSILQDRTLPRRTRFTMTVERTFQVQREAAQLHAALRSEGVAVPESPGFDELEERAALALAKLIAGEDEADAGASERARYVLLVVTSLLERLAREPLEDGPAARLARDTARMLADFVGL